MPNVRVQYGGPTVFEGTFLGDDVATGISQAQHHVAHGPEAAGGHDVQLDASDIRGTIKVTHVPTENILESRDENNTVDFMIDKDAKVHAGALQVDANAEVDGTLTVSKVLGEAVSHLDPVGGNLLTPAVDTVVQRDPTSGCVTIANLRVPRPLLNLTAEGNAPDNLPPGLFAPNITVSEQLDLIQDGRIFFEPAADNYYRFGAVAGDVDDARHIDQDGLHFSSGAGDQIKVQ